MLEILFGESEAAGMQLAKGAEPEAAAEVLCLAFQLDVGRIDMPADSPAREEILLRLYGHCAYQEEQEGLEQALKESFAVYRQHLRRLQTAAAKGEALRAWVSAAPYSRCGLFWLCHALEGTAAPLSVVELPAFSLQEDGSFCTWVDWGEVSPETMSHSLPLTRELTAPERRLYAQRWKALAAENAPLRAVVSGQLLSVPEDFYDALLLEHVTEQPQTEARILGRTLGTYPIGVGDSWYAERINAQIEQGVLKVATEDPSEYRRTLSR